MSKNVNSMVYNTVVCGGTFDFLHEGHKAFLRFAFSQGKHVVIGVTTDAYIQAHKSTRIISPFLVRECIVKNFLSKEEFLSRATILPIDTEEGPLLSKDFSADAVVVSDETRQSAEEINAKRKEIGMSLLPILSLPLVQKNGEKISASLLAKEYTIDPHTDLLLPELLRPALQLPLGEIVDGVDKKIASEKIITVGDATTKTFIEAGVVPHIVIIDFFVEREKRFSRIEDLGLAKDIPIIRVKNPAGMVMRELWQSVHAVVSETAISHVLLIEGEEDLAVLPCILQLPVGNHIYYGQPHQGIVHIVVDEKIKHYALVLLANFDEGYTRGH